MRLFKLHLQSSVCLGSVYRASFATSQPRPLSLHLKYNARSRSSKVLRGNDRPPTPSSRKPPQEEPEKNLTLSDALKDTKNEDNSLLSPVHIPEDPDGILNEKHPAASILANSGIVVQRQLELMNVMIGFEQANKYIILDPQGNHIGFMAEQDSSMGRTMTRQILSTHRSFTTHVFDKHEKEVLRVFELSYPAMYAPRSRLTLCSSIDLSHGSPPVSAYMIPSK